MNRELLLQHFDRISEAQDAIPRLRSFILDLAVRGKLVEQDPSDEPAAELVKRIQLEKARLVKEGLERKGKAPILLKADEIPYSLPVSWKWSQFSEIGFISPRNVADNDLQASFVPMPMISAEYGIPNKHEVRSWGEIRSGFTHFAEGDVGLAKITPCFENRKSTIFRQLTGGIGAGTTELHIVRPIFVVAEYMLIFLKCPHFIETGIPKMTGTAGQKRVPTEYFTSSPFPLPPLAEQHRIVSKVDELMALCGQLEAERNKREARRDRLVASSLNRISATMADEAKEATRFHLNHLPRLTTRTEHIKQLRQAILNLAVRGRLVPQDPSDEPAAELLKRMQSEKATLEKAGEIKKEKPIKAVMADEIPFDIPSHWRWVRLGELTELITKGSSPKWQGVSYSSKEDGVLFVTSENVGNYCLRKLDEPKYVEKKFNEIEPRSILRYGDILMNLVGASIGRTAVYNLPDIANINQAVALIRLVRKTAISCTSFLLHYLNSPSAIQFMTASQVVTAQPNISLTNARDFPIPFPSLAEQHRIVAKVDELMALCDQLEASLNITESDSRRMLEAVLRDALNPAVMEAA